jgi:phage recombination protein Bet
MGQELAAFSNTEIELIKRTVAPDLMPAEFDLFIQMCREKRLSPVKRQIYAILFIRNKKTNDGWEKIRQVNYVTAIDGFRAIAERTGCYRPGQRSVECDPEARDKNNNPYGIVSATASVWKLTGGEWHEYSETVWWEEYAPLKEVWENNKPTGQLQLDTSGQWGKMGRNMLMKCAEAQALRRGWPEDFSGLNDPAEIDHMRVIDITPSEQAEQGGRDRRQALLGGPQILIDWCDGDPVKPEEPGKLADRVIEFIREMCNADNPEKVTLFQQRNIAGIRQLWQHDEASGLAVNKALEPFKREAQELQSVEAAE